MTLPVDPVDAIPARKRSTSLAGKRDHDAGTYTASPIDADDELGAWLTVDETVVCELEDWC